MSKFIKGDSVFAVKGGKVIEGTYEPPFNFGDPNTWGCMNVDGVVDSFKARLIQSTREQAAQAYLDELEELNEAKRQSITRNEQKAERFKKYLSRQGIVAAKET